jgi:hypothetical protein
MYDLDRLDPDWKLAEVHGKACSPGVPPTGPEGEEGNISGRRVHGK